MLPLWVLEHYSVSEVIENLDTLLGCPLTAREHWLSESVWGLVAFVVTPSCVTSTLNCVLCTTLEAQSPRLSDLMCLGFSKVPLTVSQTTVDEQKEECLQK